MSQNKNRLGSRRKLAMQLLRNIAAEQRRSYILFFLATVVFSASSFLLPQYFLFFTENAAKISEITFDAFLPKFVIFGVIIAVILFLTTLGSNYMREWFQLKIERYLRSKILTRLHDLAITEIDKVQRGDWLTRITDDLRSVERFVAESLPQQLRSLLILVGTGGLFIFYSHSMAAVPILACLVIASINVWVQKRILPLIDEIRDLHGDVAQTLLQSLEGIKTIRSYNAQDDQKKRFSHQLVAVESKGLRVARYFGFLIGSNDAATQILTTFSLTFIMIVLSKGEMTLAAALAYPFYLNLFYSSAEFLAASSLEWNEFFVSGGRFAEITSEDEKQEPKATQFEASFLSCVEGIDVWDVSFGYFLDDPLKENFQFSCRKNEMVVILGPSGSGKSTFLEVLSGIRQPFSGNWQLTTALAASQSSFKENPLPTQLAAYVEQKPYIFEGTLRENIVLGEDKTVSSIWRALADANASDFVENNGGLDYFLQDGGQNLSEGQRYRLALSRALLRKRPFLLLDEPFASLDHMNAELIAQTLNNIKDHCGIVLVSHFIPNSLRPDRIVDFEGMPSNLFEAIPQLHELRDRVIAHKSNNIF